MNNILTRDEMSNLIELVKTSKSGFTGKTNNPVDESNLSSLFYEVNKRLVDPYKKVKNISVNDLVLVDNLLKGGKKVLVLRASNDEWADITLMAEVNSSIEQYFNTEEDRNNSHYDYNLVDSIVSKSLSDSRLERLGPLLVYKGIKTMESMYPMMKKAMNSMLLVENKETCPTLYVTYNKSLGKVELNYNPKFIAKCAANELVYKLISSSENLDLIDIEELDEFLSTLSAFLFMHEVSHIIYKHLDDKSLPANILNYPADTYVNKNLELVFTNNIRINSLMKKLGHSEFTLNTGITNSYTVSGPLNRRLLNDPSDLNSSISSSKVLIGDSDGKPSPFYYKCYRFKAYSSYISDSTNYVDYADSQKVSLEVMHVTSKERLKQPFDKLKGDLPEIIKLLIDFSSPDKIESKSSSVGESSDTNGTPEYSDEIEDNANSSSDITDEPSDETGEEGSGSNVPSEPSNDEGTGEGDSEETDASDSTSDEDDAVTDSDGDSDDEVYDSAQKSQGSGSGKSTGRSDLSEIPDDFIKNNQDAVKELSDSSGADSNGELEGLLKKLQSGKTVKGWRQLLTKMIEKSTGVVINYNADAPNSRLEGQLGREEIRTTLKDLILTFDVSASMEVEDFKKALIYLQDIMNSGYQFERVGIGYWSSDHFELAPKKIKPSLVYKTAVENQNRINHGGTPISSMIDGFIDGNFKSAKPDLIVVFTDGEFYGANSYKDLSPKQRAWYTKYRNRIIWVQVKSKYGKQTILDFDPSSAKRMVTVI